MSAPPQMSTATGAPTGFSQDPPPASSVQHELPRVATSPPISTDKDALPREDAKQLKKQLQDALIATRPKHALSGLGSGLGAITSGIAAGVAGLVLQPIAGAVDDGVKGFAKGVVSGVAGVVVMPISGIVGGAVQIGRGVYNTPEAVRATMAGKVWNKETGEWEDPPGDALQAYDEEAAKQRAALLGRAPAKDYYAVLDLKRDARPDQIKRAYFVLARKYHPDKNPGDQTANERFQAIGEAYQVLGDPARKSKYDQYGATDGGTVNAAMFFNMVFGSELFEPLVGELSIAAMARTAEMGGLSAKDLQYQRQTRIMKLLVHLGDILEPYVQGDVAGFKAKQGASAQELAGASFGETMLHTLGEVYTREADVFLGNFLEAGLLRLKAKKEEFKSKYAAVKAGMELESFRGELENDKDPSGLTEQQAAEELAKRAAVEAKGLTLALSAMWAINRADIQATVRSVCRRLLRDPSVSSKVHELRAKGLRELGAIFSAAKGPEHLAGQEAQFVEALRNMQEGAGFASEAEAGAAASST